MSNRDERHRAPPPDVAPYMDENLICRLYSGPDELYPHTLAQKAAAAGRFLAQAGDLIGQVADGVDDADYVRICYRLRENATHSTASLLIMAIAFASRACDEEKGKPS